MTTFPAHPMPPAFKGLTPEQSQIWLDAHNWVYASIVVGIQRLEDFTGTISQDGYHNMFGSSPDTPTLEGGATRRYVVLESLRKMANYMSEKVVVYEKCDDDKKCKRDNVIDAVFKQRIAFVDVFESSDGIIHLCPKGFDEDYLRFTFQDSAAWSRAFTVAHEMFHVAVDTAKTIGISDTYYTKTGCVSLAMNNPALSVRNAQNYAYYLMGENWVRPAPAPDWPTEDGPWHAPAPGGAWGETACSPAASGTDYLHKAVIVAWREPDAKGGRLWHRVLRIEPNSENWSDLMLLNRTLADGSKLPIACTGAPAVGTSLAEFFCAYIDTATKKLMFIATDQSVGFKGIPADYFNLNWHRSMEIAADPLFSATAKPAIVAYRDVAGAVRNASLGIYCMYVDTYNELKCRVMLDTFSGESSGSWVDLPLDKYRKTFSMPALVVLNGQLKCIYWNESGVFITLTYQPVIEGAVVPSPTPVGHASKLGHWQEDPVSIAALSDTNMVSLGTLNLGHQLLMAVRNKYVGSEAGSLFYSACNGKVWSPDTRMPVLTSLYCPAQASCGSTSYLFFANAEGRIQGRKKA